MATTGAKSSNQGTGAQDLTADIQQLRDDITKLSEHLRETGNKSMSRAREAAMQSADEWQQELVDTVREKPLTALAVAAGAGWLLAMLMRR